MAVRISRNLQDIDFENLSPFCGVNIQLFGLRKFAIFSKIS